MNFLYRKNSHKLKMFVPMGENEVEFWVVFEKGRKKSTKGLYRLSFEISNLSEGLDYEFLATGFLHLIKNFA
jgi:hypothetical protein